MSPTTSRFVINLGARVIPIGVAGLIAIYSPSEEVKSIAYSGAILFLIVSEYFGTYRPMLNWDETRRKILDIHMANFVETAKIGAKKPKIRINIMVARLWLNGKHFFQFHQSGMAGYPDADAHFKITKGHCGKSFAKRSHEVFYVDFRNMSKSEIESRFGLSAASGYATDHIKAIACVPMFSERKSLRGFPKTKFWGVLNVDATDDAGADFLAKPEIHKHIMALAKLVQTALS